MKRDTGSYYPIFLNIRDRKCVVIGGGQVALRKVTALLEHGATVEVISPALCPELARLAESRELHAVRRNYRMGDLEGAIAAIAATDSNQVNLEVARDARTSGILVNVVDVPEKSDFILPSYLRRGDISIAISTSGRSPALARKIRTRLEKEFGEEYAALALLIDEVRTEVKSKGMSIEANDWQKALDLDALLTLLKNGNREEATTMLLDNLKGLQK